MVRKNDDTGLDKLLHFMYSAMHAYYWGRRNSFLKGFGKELLYDEFMSYINSKDIGWDNKDMKANARGIDCGITLRNISDYLERQNFSVFDVNKNIKL